MKTLVVGYNHSRKDKRVMRTVEIFCRLGPVCYQFSGENSAFSNDFQRNLRDFSLCRDEMPGRGKLIKRIRLDREILKLVKELDYDLAYFHSFPASQPIKLFREVKKRGKKLLYDLHEIMPVQFLPEKYSFLNPVLWRILKAQLSLVDGVIGVSDEAMKMMFEKTGIARPLLIIPNYAATGIQIGRNAKNAEIAVVGGTSRKITINGNLLKELKKNFKLISIGTNCDIVDEELPFMNYDLMMDRISKVKYTLLAFQSRSDPQYPNDIYSLPNKFYDSLAAGTPVIIDDRFVSMKKIIEETNTGLILDLSKEPDRDLSLILNAPGSYDSYLENLGRYYDRFVWDNSKEDCFVDFIATIMNS
ncbi:MAG: glycosyltransferase [Mesotoga sp.]|nr:glycosyltransferase [Mesotoga sp.]MBP8660779.1 glycosyltransferase [Mesotoga sp.]MDD4039605.1 glycosyltransferase [Mesotoga sp.]HON27683.1 glycosyltransferase [Mesotoga infera]